MFQHWPSIESLHRVKTDVLSYKDVYGIQLSPITYRGKVKLHGTNAGIIIKPNGKVIPQSRTRIISTGADNIGFASFVKETESYWASLRVSNNIVVVFGEWCGRGIMKGVAISAAPEKVFAVFAVQLGPSNDDNSSVYVDPQMIDAQMFVDEPRPANVYTLPWYGDEVVVDFFDKDSLLAAVDKMNAAVADVEACDPWVKEVFGIAGLGEGLVYYPVSMYSPNGTLPRDNLSRYLFKAKGEKHKVVKTKDSVVIDPEVAATISDFVNMVATEARMEQALTEGAKGVIDKRLVGPVIAWFSKDVKKDIDNGEVILPEGIEWKLVAKQLTSRIQKWYFSKLGF